MEQRIGNIEGTIGTITAQLSAFEQEVKRLFEAIDSNDKNVKDSIEKHMEKLNGNLALLEKTQSDKNGNIDTEIALTKSNILPLDNRVTIVEGETISIMNDRVAPMETELQNMTAMVQAKIQEIA